MSEWVTEWGIRFPDGVVLSETNRLCARAEQARRDEPVKVVSRQVEYGDWEEDPDG